MNTVIYKKDFSLNNIIYLIRILRFSQKSNILPTITELCYACDVNKKNQNFRTILDILEDESCIKFTYSDNNKYVQIDENQLRGSIIIQEQLKELKYYFKKEVSTW